MINPDVLKITRHLRILYSYAQVKKRMLKLLSMLFIYFSQDESADATLIVNASSVFNRLNRQVPLRISKSMCPTLAIIETNLQLVSRGAQTSIQLTDLCVCLVAQCN